MEKAIVIIDGEERLIGARELAFCHGSVLRNRYTRAICPVCHQEVNFYYGQYMAPHFRHESNNSIARQCELYAQGEGGGTPYERIPPPVFIRKKYGSPGMFVVEMGIKRIKDSTLSRLEREGAKLVVPDGDGKEREYCITRERFGGGLLRVPVGYAGGCSLSGVRLTRTSMSFRDVWGASPSIGRDAVFTCDRDSLSGRKIESLGSVSIGESVLIVSKSSADALRGHFPDVKKVGLADGKVRRVVYLATVEGCSAAFLGQMSIMLGRSGDAPQVLWPPSLVSEGAIIPLFAKSKGCFRVWAERGKTGVADNRLFSHAWTDGRTPRTVPMEETCDRDWMVAIVQPVSGVRFMSTSNRSLSNTILLGFKEMERVGRPTDSDGRPKVGGCENGYLKVTTLCGCEIKAMRRDGRGETLHASAGDACRLRLGGLGVLRISVNPVVRDHGDRLLLEFTPESSDRLKHSAREHDGHRWSRDIASISQDRLFAESRGMSQRVVATQRDIQFALARKAAK